MHASAAMTMMAMPIRLVADNESPKTSPPSTSA
jgi:hypothetical protein